MATAAETSRNCCFVCQKPKVTYKCTGCSKEYCKQHLRDHENELELELDQIENERNIFRQTFSERIEQPDKQHLIQQINQWERHSIKKIQESAEENRQLILNELNQHFKKIEIDLSSFTNEIKEIRQENDFNEVNLNDLRNKLENLRKQLDNPASISVRQKNQSSFINSIYVNFGYRKEPISSDIKERFYS